MGEDRAPHHESFSNISVVLLIYSLPLFLIGLVSEQISALHYKGVEDDQRRTQRDQSNL